MYDLELDFSGSVFSLLFRIHDLGFRGFGESFLEDI